METKISHVNFSDDTKKELGTADAHACPAPNAEHEPPGAPQEPGQQENGANEQESLKSNPFYMLILILVAVGVLLGVGGMIYSYSAANQTASEREPRLEIVDMKVSPDLGNREYFVGDTLDPSEITLTVTYSDGSTEIITEGFRLLPLQMTEPGKEMIEVIYRQIVVYWIVDVQERP